MGKRSQPDVRPSNRHSLDKCRIVDAYRYVETQQKIGNVVMTLAGDLDRQR